MVRINIFFLHLLNIVFLTKLFTTKLLSNEKIVFSIFFALFVWI